jgi:hypothetical protein
LAFSSALPSSTAYGAVASMPLSAVFIRQTFGTFAAQKFRLSCVPLRFFRWKNL